jgi:hypothetical protein
VRRLLIGVQPDDDRLRPSWRPVAATLLAFAGASQIWALPVMATMAALLCAPYVAFCYWAFGVRMPWVLVEALTNLREMPRVPRRERRQVGRAA